MTTYSPRTGARSPRARLLVGLVLAGWVLWLNFQHTDGRWYWHPVTSYEAFPVCRAESTRLFREYVRDPARQTGPALWSCQPEAWRPPAGMAWEGQ